MSAESPKAVGAAVRQTRWSETEKLALMIGVIRSFKTPVPWHEVAVPAGRTVGTCKYMLDTLLKASAGVPLTEGAARASPAKRGSKAPAVDENGNPIATPTKKRSRKAANGEDDGEKPAKKPRAPRKPKATPAPKVTEPAPDDEEDGDDAEANVKAQPEDGDNEGDNATLLDEATEEAA